MESDGMSIVGVEARSIGTSILRSYYFQVQRDWDDHTDGRSSHFGEELVYTQDQNDYQNWEKNY